MLLRIILWLSIIWLAPLICLLLKNEAKFKKNIVVGVTLPFAAHQDDEVLSRLSRFKKQLTWVCVLLIAAAAPCMFVGGFGVSMSLWCAWLIPCIIVPYIPYALCNRDLKKIKNDRGWSIASSDRVTIDTAAIPSNRWMSPWLFALPFVIGLLPIFWDTDFWPIYAVDCLCVALFWLCYRYLYRNKSETVDGDMALTKALTQVRRRNWGIVWIVASYSMAALNFCILLTHDNPVLMLAAIFAVSIVLVFAVLRVEMNTRHVQEKLTQGSGLGSYVDDDDKWIWGIFYYNPRDSHSIVNDRVGTNSSFNMAKPAGKICMGLVVLILLAMPFMGPMIDAAADSPITLELTVVELTASSGKTEYTVLLSDIEDVALLDALPDKMVRTNGTGLDNLLKGHFSSSSIGKMLVCLDPGCSPFILITTVEGQHYLFGTRTPDETIAVYEKIK